MPLVDTLTNEVPGTIERQEINPELYVDKSKYTSSEDNWKHRSTSMVCKTCMFFVRKESNSPQTKVLGRCRRNAPTIKGFPAVFETDWCGDHKLDEHKI